MAGLVPAIHVLTVARERRDPRANPENDARDYCSLPLTSLRLFSTNDSAAGPASSPRRTRSDALRRLDCSGANLRGGLGFGLGDLRLGGRRAALDEVGHLLLRLAGQALRLVLGVGDDLGGLALGGGALGWYSRRSFSASSRRRFASASSSAMRLLRLSREETTLPGTP